MKTTETELTAEELEMDQRMRKFGYVYDPECNGSFVYQMGCMAGDAWMCARLMNRDINGPILRLYHRIASVIPHGGSLPYVTMDELAHVIGFENGSNLIEDDDARIPKALEKYFDRAEFVLGFSHGIADANLDLWEFVPFQPAIATN